MNDPYAVFVLSIAALGHKPEREVRFCERRWRFDFAWPAEKVALEVEGGIWTGQGHARPANILRDILKYNRATLDGWRVIRATPQQVKEGLALEWVMEALNGRG